MDQRVTGGDIGVLGSPNKGTGITVKGQPTGQCRTILLSRREGHTVKGRVQIKKDRTLFFIGHTRQFIQEQRIFRRRLAFNTGEPLWGVIGRCDQNQKIIGDTFTRRVRSRHTNGQQKPNVLLLGRTTKFLRRRIKDQPTGQGGTILQRTLVGQEITHIDIMKNLRCIQAKKAVLGGQCTGELVDHRRCIVNIGNRQTKLIRNRCAIGIGGRHLNNQLANILILRQTTESTGFWIKVKPKFRQGRRGGCATIGATGIRRCRFFLQNTLNNRTTLQRHAVGGCIV